MSPKGENVVTMTPGKAIPRQKSLLAPIKACIELSRTFIPMFAVPTLAMISFIIWIFISLPLSFLDRNFGKFLSYTDTWMDEDFSLGVVPRGSIVVTLALDGPLSLPVLKNAFIKNVLNARIPNSNSYRYPQLKQFTTNFLGFRIWRNDPDFKLSNHIVHHSSPLNFSNNCSQSTAGSTNQILNQIHEEMINKPYSNNRSPWEIVLIPNVSVSPDNTTRKCIIAARIHHVMADAKSVLKLFVEGLGQKQLKVAEPKNSSKTPMESLMFYINLIPNSLNCIVDALRILIPSHSHPWKVYGFWKDQNSRYMIRFSPSLSLNDIKYVAKVNGVTTTAVCFSIISGAIRNCDIDGIGSRDVAASYPLPMLNHPTTMINHFYLTVVTLPTSIACPLKRLEECHRMLTESKEAERGKMSEFHKMTYGSLLYSWSSQLSQNRLIPICLTNIAGDEDGFSVAGLPCSDFAMSVGTSPGVAGAMFCIWSYRDKLQIGVTAKESIVSSRHVDKLALDCEIELENLKEIAHERMKYSKTRSFNT